jgi:ADP-heptose:LPS heptosyltransferase
LAQKILVIRFSSIGDIVLTTPVLRTLHQQLGAEVHFLTKSAFAPMLLSNPHVARVITLTDDFDDMLNTLKSQQYDHIIDLHHNIRTKRIKIALARPSTAFRKLNFQKWLLVRFGINRLPDTHIVDRYLAAGYSLGIKKDGRGLDVYIPPGKEIDIRATFGTDPGTYVAMVIGAAHLTKCLTTDQITRLCNSIGRPVILLGGKDEMTKAQSIIKSTTSASVHDASGRFDILQSASIIRQAGVVITHDTGLMHIAAALQKQQVVIWGNTVPEFGMYPYYGDDKTRWISIEQKGLPCRPCSKLGFPECPKGHFKCMLSHDMNAIVAAAGELFASAIVSSQIG